MKFASSQVLKTQVLKTKVLKTRVLKTRGLAEIQVAGSLRFAMSRLGAKQEVSRGLAAVTAGWV